MNVGTVSGIQNAAGVMMFHMPQKRESQKLLGRIPFSVILKSTFILTSSYFDALGF